MVVARPPRSGKTRDLGDREATRNRRAQLQRVRRTRHKAKQHLQRYMLATIRAGIFPLSSYDQLPEVARMNWLLARCRKRGWAEEVEFAAMMIDCAARSPLYTRAAAASVLSAGHKCTGEAAVVRLMTLHKSRTWPSFWKGRSSGIVTSMDSWKAADVLKVARRLSQAASKTKRTQRMLEQLRTLRGIGPYLALGMLRLVMAVLSPGCMRDTASAAACMSDHVQVLHAVLPFNVARRSLLGSGISCARHWDAGFAAYLFCEVAKVLRHAEVLGPLSQYQHRRPLLEADLASSRAEECLQQLETAVTTLPLEPRISEEIVVTARTLGLPQHSMVQVQSLLVYKQLCGQN